MRQQRPHLANDLHHRRVVADVAPSRHVASRVADVGE